MADKADKVEKAGKPDRAEEQVTEQWMRDRAQEIGLTRLTPEHVQQLLTATKAANARRGVLRFDTLTYADEPAHVYFLPEQ